MNDEELQRQMIEKAETFVDFLKSANAPHTYDRNTLVWLEQYVAENSKNFSEDIAKNMIWLGSAFLGECIRRHYGGKWTYQNNIAYITLEGINTPPVSAFIDMVKNKKRKAIVFKFDSMEILLDFVHEEKRKRDNQ